MANLCASGCVATVLVFVSGVVFAQQDVVSACYKKAEARAKQVEAKYGSLQHGTRAYYETRAESSAAAVHVWTQDPDCLRITGVERQRLDGQAEAVGKMIKRDLELAQLAGGPSASGSTTDRSSQSAKPSASASDCRRQNPSLPTGTCQ